MRHKGIAREEGSKMNSKDRNGLYGGGSIRPCGSDRKCNSRSSRINTTRVAATSGSDMITISRPKRLRSTYSRMMYVKFASMLVMCAAATIVVSALVAPVVKAPPGTPYLLYGYTYDALGNPVEADITVTNLNTGEVNTTNSYIVPPWPLDGYYEIDLNNQFPSGCTDGDLINVTAIDISGTIIGWNESAVPGGGSMTMDVTLNGTYSGIPEFPTVIVPVAGMLALFAVVSLRRRGEDQ
jgi:hypothetical protein